MVYNTTYGILQSYNTLLNTVDYIITMTLTDGEDYTADPRTLTFSPGMSRVCFNTTILDDDRYELNEDFFVNITTSDPQTDINPMSAIVTIEDDEGV